MDFVIVGVLQAEPTASFLDRFTEYIVRNNLGDLASVLGVLATIVTFVVTIISVLLAKSAAEKAREAADAMRRSIHSYDVMIDLVRAIEIMEEIKRHQRAKQWTILPDRYSTLKQCMRSVGSGAIPLSPEHQAAIRSAIAQVTEIEKTVERAFDAKIEPASPSKLTIIMNEQITKLHGVFIAIRDSVER